MSKDCEFDVFLSHNSADKPLIELIAKRLKDEFGLNPFLDKWNLIPGKTWPKELERALDQSATTAVFLGAGDEGPWHDQEMQRALVKAVKTHEEYRIIPVLLPGPTIRRSAVFWVCGPGSIFEPGWTMSWPSSAWSAASRARPSTAAVSHFRTNPPPTAASAASRKSRPISSSGAPQTSNA